MIKLQQMQIQNQQTLKRLNMTDGTEEHEIRKLDKEIASMRETFDEIKRSE